MSIRFQCTDCARSLRVADEKAGKQVRCPSCKAAVRVPSETPAAPPPEPPPAAKKTAAPPPVPDEAPAYFDDPPSNVAPSAAPGNAAFGPASDFVSISRRALYAQGILLATVALIAFCLGHAVGGRGAPSAAAPHTPPAGPFRIDGELTFPDGNGQRGDAGAVIVVLPQGPFPDERIPIEGLRPTDSTAPEDTIGVRAIESLGGVYRRANGQGAFDVSLPNGGKYYLLFLSKSARRADDERIMPEHLSVMASYFQNAAELLADRRYDWKTIDVSDNTRIDHAFVPRRR